MTKLLKNTLPWVAGLIVIVAPVCGLAPVTWMHP